MRAVIIPLGIYVISALLLYFETQLVSRALERVRTLPGAFQRGLAVFSLMIPLVVMPFVPIAFLLTLDYDGQATVRGYLYCAMMWVGGVLAALPSYVYLTRRARDATERP